MQQHHLSVKSLPQSRAQGSQAKAVGSGTRQWARRGARLHSAHGDLTGSGHRDWCSLVFAKYTEVANCYVTKYLMASDMNERCKHELTVHITETLRCNQHKQPQPIQVVRHNSKGNFKIIKVAVFRVPNTRRHVIGCWSSEPSWRKRCGWAPGCSAGPSISLQLPAAPGSPSGVPRARLQCHGVTEREGRVPEPERRGVHFFPPFVRMHTEFIPWGQKFKYAFRKELQTLRDILCDCLKWIMA